MAHHKKEYDVIFLNNIIRCYSFIGTFPSDEKILLLFLPPYFLAGATFYLKIACNYFNERCLSLTGMSLLILIMINVILYSLVCLKDSWSPLDKWNNIFNDIEFFDYKLKKNIMMLRKCTVNFKLLLGNILCAILEILTYRPELNSIVYAISSSYLYIVHLQIFATTLVLNMVFDMLVKRFECLRCKTIEVYTSINKDRLFWNSLQLKDSYLLLVNTVQKINERFGQRMLLILILTFLSTLGNFQYYFLEDMQLNSSDIRSFFGYGVQSLNYWVSK